MEELVDGNVVSECDYSAMTGICEAAHHHPTDQPAGRHYH